jgi:23S rRNA pseudouridine1911/1915/1917 synthase
MVFARTSKAASRLSAQVRERTIGKHYLAVVRGRPEPSSGAMDDYLIKDRATNRVQTCGSAEGQAAHLDYETVSFDPVHNMSLVRILLGTGRSHQIRVQFSSRGWPLAGDRRYGPEGGGKMSVPYDLALLAQRLAFNHPTKNERLDFEIEPPATEPWLYFIQ